MSPLRQEAIQLLEKVPEEKLVVLIKIMQTQFGLLTPEEDLARKQKAFEELQKIIRSKKINLPADFDCKEELARYREERFGNANPD